MTIVVDFSNGYFFVTSPRWDRRAAAATTAKFVSGAWRVDSDPADIRYLTENFDKKYFTAAAAARVLQEKATVKKAETFPAWYRFKNEPMDRQWDALNDAYSNEHHALLMEMGTGKTFVTVNTAAARAMDGKINALVVVCPTSVIPVWDIELSAHCPIAYDLHEVKSGRVKSTEDFIVSETNGLKVLVVGIEALSQGSAAGLVTRFISCYRAMMVIDESSRIKNPDANRTKKTVHIGSGCKYRMILSGTPVTQGIHDLYSQYRFLDWKIIGQKSYFTFKNRYCIMGGFEGKSIMGYVNQEELISRISPHTTIIKKSEMIDLPPKVYEPLQVEPSPTQKKALKELGDPFSMMTVVDDKLLVVETILERMTRYQQIVGGHFPFKEDGDQQIMRFSGSNPKLDAMMASIDDLPADAKVIIWARFTPEIEWIEEALNKKYGKGSAVKFYGATPRDERKQILVDFQNEGGPRFFISNPAMGGIGITLTAATYTYYYSNTFSLEDRLQSEDRNHRKGQQSSVTYIDITMNHAIDKAMIAALKSKKEMADYVNDELQQRTKR